MTPGLAGLLAASLAAASAPAAAATQADARRSFALPASAGDVAVNRLAIQADISVAITVNLRDRRSRPLHGRFTPEEAFERLLRPMGARAVRVSPGIYRVEARPVSPRPAPTRAPPATPQPVEPAVLDEVVVTGSVRRGGLDGVNGRSQLAPDALSRAAGSGSGTALADLSATVESTRQGMGRNKLFVRGVADSALSGPLQATIGQYLGEFRLNYGAPDPDLALVDIARIEVFEGPQGGRFGSGSIGGVVRLEPAAPDPAARYGELRLSASLPRGGETGGDGALVINQPLGPRTAARLVAYGGRQGGVLDNRVRGEDDADPVDTLGGRLSLRWVGDRWTVDALGVVQTIAAGDAPLVRDPDRLETDRPMAEPYDSDLALIGVAASGRIGQARVTTATTVSRQALDERFDGSILEASQTVVIDRRQTVLALSSETRVSLDLGPRWSLNLGAAGAIARTEVRRVRRPDDEPEERIGLERDFFEAAVFGEAIWRPAETLSLSFGGRVSGVRLGVDIPSADIEGAPVPEPDLEIEATPALGARWRLPVATLFGRYEQAIRPGDVNAAPGFGQVYRSDRVTLLETGVVFDREAVWSLETSVGVLDWDNIQSDLITTGGDLITTNIGDGRIEFWQVRGQWRPTDRLRLSGGAFVNRNRLESLGFGVIGVTGGPIPNVAPAGVQVSVAHGPLRIAGLPTTLSGDFRYIGRSRPGLGPGLSREQGGYVEATLQARFGDERRALVVAVSNPLDATATRFGVGSPFQLTGAYVAPIRPLTLRIGLEAAF